MVLPQSQLQLLQEFAQLSPQLQLALQESLHPWQQESEQEFIQESEQF